MSRAFHPPDTLSKEDIRTIAQVRRDVWTGGVTGLLLGSSSGYVLHTISRVFHNRLSDASKGKMVLPGSDMPIRFNRNTAFLAVMAGGALGSFAFATAAGKNKVHNLHNIFEIGKKDTQTPYQKSLALANADENSLAERELRRLSRRKSVRMRLEESRGLSDSHGGQWIRDEERVEERQKRRLSRRKTVQRRLENGHGLSDSHGGQWLQDRESRNE